MLNELCDLAPATDELIQQLKSTRLSTWQDDDMEALDRVLEKKDAEIP